MNAPPIPRYRPARLPGFHLTLGLTVSYLSLVVLIPLAVLLLRGAGQGWEGFYAQMSQERVLLALRLSFTTAVVAALVNALGGTVVAWVLTRYRFPGRSLLDAAIDLPFALPTAVAGIALTALYAGNGWLGGPLELFGVKVAYAPAGIVVALIFVGLPFVVRTVQPVLEGLEVEVEEAAASLGAGRVRTILTIVLPALFPAILTGFAMAFARGVGEYGSIVFISGNMPFKTEIAPLLIVTQLEQYNYAGAEAIALTMLGISFLCLLGINLLQRWTSRRLGQGA